MSVIEAEGLTKVYRTYRKEQGIWGAVKGLAKRQYDETRAADNVTFRIEEGEFVGFLGPNGAGKTTVLKMLSGLLYPSSGRASVLGFVPWERRNEMKRQFSLLMGQKNALWWDLPARESLELNRAIYGIEEKEFRAIVDGLTALLDVADKMNVMVRELSLGERMKMELIAALLHSPKVLFLDEPTIGLDVVSQKKVREFLRAYNAEHGVVTVLTSHYMQDIEELCKRVIVIDGGKIIFDGPLEGITERYAVGKILQLEFDGHDGSRDFTGLGESRRAHGHERASCACRARRWRRCAVGCSRRTRSRTSAWRKCRLKMSSRGCSRQTKVRSRRRITRNRVVRNRPLFERLRAGLGDGLILRARAAADPDGAHDLVAAFERDAAGKNHDLAVVGSMDAVERFARLREGGECLGGNVESTRGPGLLDGDVDAAQPGFVHAREGNEAAAAIDDGDVLRLAGLHGFFLGSVDDFEGFLQGNHG